jgi:hypothetical protein
MHPIAFLIVCSGFSPATGELTANLKVRRTAIAEKLAEPLHKLAGEAQPFHPDLSGELALKFI